MADFSFAVPTWTDGTPTFPDGTFVNATPLDGSVDDGVPAVVSVGAVALTGLLPHTQYLARGVVNGVVREVRFLSGSDTGTSATSGTGVSRQAAQLAQLLGVMTSGRDGLYLARHGTTYSLMMGLGGGKFWQQDLYVPAHTGTYDYEDYPTDAVPAAGNDVHQMGRSIIGVGLTSVPFSDGTVSTSGTVTNTTQALAYGGSYHYVSSATDYIQRTFTGTVAAFRYVTANNGGWAKVLIDGDATLADSCLMASEAVTAGNLPSTALTGNGGTLNPTDRVFEFYSGSVNYDNLSVLAADLSSGSHTLRFVNTGYKRTAGTATRVYATGFGDTTALPLTDASVTLFSVASLNSGLTSAWEYAIRVHRYGSTTPADWAGQIHRHQFEDGFATYVDGVAVTLADGETRRATRDIDIVRTDHLVVPEDHATTMAVGTCTYHLEPGRLAVTPSLTWQVDVDFKEFLTMMPLNGATATAGAINRAFMVQIPDVMKLTAADAFLGNSKSFAGLMWGAGLNAGMLTWLDDVEAFTLGWTHNQGELTRIQDRSATAQPFTSKLYFGRKTSNGAVLTARAGQTDTWTINYLAGFRPGFDAIASAL